MVLPRLHEAVYQGRLDEVRARLDAGDDIHAWEEFRYDTPLYWAIASGNLQMVEYLISRGAKYAIYPGEGGQRSSPRASRDIGLFAQAVHVSCVERPYFPRGYSTLEVPRRYVEDSERIKVVEFFLIREKAPDQAVNQARVRPCIESRKFDLARHLLNRGVSIKEFGEKTTLPEKGALLFQSPLFAAHFKGDEKEVARLLSNGAGCTKADFISAMEWVMYAAGGGRRQYVAPGARRYVSECIKRGFKLDREGLERWQPQAYFRAALISLMPELAQMLLETGLVTANQYLDDRNNTALHYLAAVREFSSFLFDTKGLPDCWNEVRSLVLYPTTAEFQWKVEREKTRAVLLKFGADETMPNGRGEAASFLDRKSNKAYFDWYCGIG